MQKSSYQKLKKKIERIEVIVNWFTKPNNEYFQIKSDSDRGFKQAMEMIKEELEKNEESND